MREALALAWLTVGLAVLGAAAIPVRFGFTIVNARVWLFMAGAVGAALLVVVGILIRRAWLLSSALGVLWAITVVTLFSVGPWLLPAAVLGFCAAVVFAAPSAGEMMLSPIWWSLGFSSVPFLLWLDDRRRDIEVRTSSSYLLSRIQSSAFVVYGAWMFGALATTMVLVWLASAILRKRS